jgi:polyisoprenoid-binding protein YceI
MLRSGIWLSLFFAALAFGCGETKPTAPAANTSASAPSTAGAPAAETPGEAKTGQKFTEGEGLIQFVGTKPDGKHEGGFNDFEGFAVLGSGDKPIESITVDINTEQLWADDGKLTAHLMNQDFFDVKQHPKATFVSKSIDPAPGGYKVTGDLTLLGKTGTVEFPAEITKHDGKIDFNADFEISRKQFGMTYGEGKIDDPVKIKTSFTVPAN